MDAGYSPDLDGDLQRGEASGMFDQPDFRREQGGCARNIRSTAHIMTLEKREYVSRLT